MRREEGPLSVEHLDRHSIRFAIGPGPYTYTTPAAVKRAQERLEESGEETVQLAGYWIDETDLEALR